MSSTTEQSLGHDIAADHRVLASRRMTRRNGPIGPWRMCASLTAAGVVSGGPLLDAMMTGDGLDDVLLRSLGIGMVAWFALGIADRILASAEIASHRSVDAPDEVAGSPAAGSSAADRVESSDPV